MSSAAAHLPLPSDPQARRALWREWIASDAPGERVPVRRAAVQADDWLDEALPRPAGVVAGLRSAIEASIFDGQITLADRERLTSRAVRLGLSRFEASLLIAAVLHRNGGRLPSRVTVVRRRWTIGRIVMAGLAIEAIAATAAYAWLTH